MSSDDQPFYTDKLDRLNRKKGILKKEEIIKVAGTQSKIQIKTKHCYTKVLQNQN